jgi:hypothetical protein
MAYLWKEGEEMYRGHVPIVFVVASTVAVVVVVFVFVFVIRRLHQKHSR